MLFDILAFSLPILGVVSPHGAIYPLILSALLSLKERCNGKSLQNLQQVSPPFLRKFKGRSRLLLFWIFLSCLWAPFTLDAFGLFFRIAMTIFFSLCWSRHLRKNDITLKIIKFLFFSSLLVAAFAFFDQLLGLKIVEKFRKVAAAKAYTQAGIILLLNFWVVLPWITRQKKMWLLVPFIVLHFLTFKLIDCDTTLVTLIISGIIFYLALYKWDFTYKWVRRLLIFGMISAPFIGIIFTKERVWDINKNYIRDGSIIHRLNIWHSVSEQIFKKPFVGFGLNASRHRAEYKKPDNYYIIHENGVVSQNDAPPTLCMHPHHFALQLWLELGFVGIMLCLGMLLALLRYINTLQDNLQRASSIGAYTSILMIGLFSVGIWQTWWIATLGYLMPIILFYKQIPKNENIIDAEYEVL